MAVERKLPGWGMWGRWVLLSAVGFTASAFVGMCLAWAVVGIVPTGETTPKFFSMAYLDTIRASITLGREDPIGELSGGRDLRYSVFFGPGGELFYWSMTIVLGGLMQWLVLRRHAERAVWWALPVPLAFAYHGLTADNPLTVGGGISLLVFHAKDFGILGALYSMIVGVPLVWFLRRSYRQDKRVGNASL